MRREEIATNRAPSGQSVVLSTQIDDVATGSSSDAARAVEVLRQTGIEAEQHRYVLPDTTGFNALPGAIPEPQDRIRVAVTIRTEASEQGIAALRAAGFDA